MVARPLHAVQCVRAVQRAARLFDPGACGRSAEAADAQAAAQRREARLDAAGAAVRGREDAAMRAEALLGAEREALAVKLADYMLSHCYAMAARSAAVSLWHSPILCSSWLRITCVQLARLLPTPLCAHSKESKHMA